MKRPKKKYFMVEVREIHSATVFMEADTEEEAWEKFKMGECDWGVSAYLDTLDSEETYTAPKWIMEEGY